jgi:hypothetical protein
MNAKEHPLNKAAEARFKKDNLPRDGGLALFDLFWQGLAQMKGDLEGHEDEPESLVLANAASPRFLSNSLGLLEAEITPEEVLELPLQGLAESALSALTYVPHDY